MKKSIITIIICIVLISVVSCTNNEKSNNVDELLEANENQASFEWDGVEYQNNVTALMETTNRFYKVNIKGVLEAYDKESGSIIELCVNPECEHNTEECNALFNWNFCSQLYKGRIYADMKETEKNQKIVSVNLDGTDKKEVFPNVFKRRNDIVEEMEGRGATGFSTAMRWYINDDKIYIATVIEVSFPNRQTSSSKMYIDVYDLQSGDWIECLVEESVEGINPLLTTLYIYEGQLYMELYVSQNYEDTRIYYKVNEKTGQLESVQPKDRVVGILVDDKVVCYKKDGHVYVCDWKSEQMVSIELTDVEKEYGIRLNSAGEYICILPYYYSAKAEELAEKDYYIKIYDKNFNYITTVELQQDVFVQGGHNQILMCERGKEVYYYIESSFGESGSVELKKYGK